MSDAAPKSECAELLRTIDWSQTSLGPYEQWPERLRGYVAMVMELPVPAIIFWEMRMLPFGDRVRLIAVTRYGQQADRQRAFAAGFDARHGLGHVIALASPFDATSASRALRNFV